MRSRRLISTVATVLGVLASLPASAAVYNITWLDMTPVPMTTPVPNASVFNAPGIGPVMVTKSIGSLVNDSRSQNPQFIVGSVLYSGDTYQWANYEHFGTILTAGPDPLVPVTSTITYTFPFQLAPGVVYVGTIGLGSTTSFGGGSSVTTVSQNGTFLGDEPGPGGFGPSLFTGVAGSFTVQNSLSAPGGLDPHWNTQLGVVRINDYVSSITIHQDGIRGDGIGVNVGFIPDFQTATTSPSWGRLKKLYK